ncbi:MAG: PhnD/SsuA/transferrin family substrate-binding protein [Propionibacteriales bacterium]|nr:PhnD/SsuA/transferrin family substrate-binding protein [Propionibacteriales bacterium]
MVNPSTPVRLGCFYRSLPMMVAQQNGYFDEVGIEVEYQQVTSSTQQFEYLQDGRYDVVQTSPDNTANYRYNDGNPIGTRVDGKGFMGMDYGMQLIVVARSGIESLGQLRGRTVAVDAPASGFAYALYEILERAGLRRDIDYSVVSAGGVYDRYQAFVNSDEFDATLLSGGFETRAANAGFVMLDSVYDVANPYLGVWGAATTSWLEGSRDTAEALVAAYRSATRWCFEPGNHEQCLDLLMQQPDTPRGLAEQLYDIQLREGVGNVPDVGIEPEAVRNVLRLREKFGGFEGDVDVEAVTAPGGDLYDLSLLRAVERAG